MIQIMYLSPGDGPLDGRLVSLPSYAMFSLFHRQSPVFIVNSCLSKKVGRSTVQLGSIGGRDFVLVTYGWH